MSGRGGVLRGLFVLGIVYLELFLLLVWAGDNRAGDHRHHKRQVLVR